MKWWIITSICVGALIALGVGAVDERDVVWEGRTPLCPYCRAELPMHALVCKECNRSLDWLPVKEECAWCLDRKDADHMNDLFEEIRQSGRPLPETLAPFGAGYFRMDEGACTYCGGVGRVVEAGADVECPVCGGTRHCLACGGDRAVVVGAEEAHRRALARARTREDAERRARITDLPLNQSELLRGDREALQGYAEIEADPRCRALLEKSRTRLQQAFRALHAEYERVKREGAQAGS